MCLIVLRNLEVIQLFARLNELAAMAAPTLEARSAATSFKVVFLLHVGTIHALQYPTPMSQPAQSTPRCTVTIESVITLLGPMLVSVVIFAVDHAGTTKRFYAQITRREAVPEGLIVRARHIEIVIGGLVQ